MLFKSFSLSLSRSLFQNLFVFKRQAFYLDFAMLLSDALGYNFVYTLHFLRKRINTQTSRDGFIVRWSCERTNERTCTHTRRKVQTLVRVCSSTYVRMLPVEMLTLKLKIVFEILNWNALFIRLQIWNSHYQTFLVFYCFRWFLRLSRTNFNFLV
jgi:hypothetical protein